MPEIYLVNHVKLRITFKTQNALIKFIKEGDHWSLIKVIKAITAIEMLYFIFWSFLNKFHYWTCEIKLEIKGEIKSEIKGFYSFYEIVPSQSKTVKKKNSTQEISRVPWEWNQFNAKRGGIRIQGFCAFVKFPNWKWTKGILKRYEWPNQNVKRWKL